MDLIIDVTRKYLKADYTIDKVQLDNVYFCDILEPTDRGLKKDMTLKEIFKLKKKGRTAIPIGRYEVKVTWSPKYRRQMPILCDVPGFEGVRIHSGNTYKDTEACLLPGKNTRVGMVTSSRIYTSKIYEEINKAVKRKERIWVDIHY